MKKSIIKKLFIKLSKIMGYEVIDQNSFMSPTLERELNKDLSKINEKSIVLPLGEVKISRKDLNNVDYIRQIYYKRGFSGPSFKHAELKEY